VSVSCFGVQRPDAAFEGSARRPASASRCEAPKPFVKCGFRPPHSIHGFGVAVLILCASSLVAVAEQRPSPVKQTRENGPLVYVTDAAGNRVPDFSSAGYRGGGVALPGIPAHVLVHPIAGDNTLRVQTAIDYVSGLTPDAAGFRGAVQLAPGRFEFEGRLKVQASGVVLRGAGQGRDETTLVALGSDRRALIELGGSDRRQDLGSAVAVTDAYVPAGALRLKVSTTNGISKGTSVTIERPSPAEWITALGMHEAPGRQPYIWKPGAFNLRWDRVVVAVDDKTITLDAPLTTALEARWGGGTITPYAQTGYVTQSGVENLRCESAFDAANPLDEQHAWNAIDLHAASDVWVTDVTAVHFAGSAVQVGAKVARATVQDCTALAPVSEIGGYRRMAFHTRGQQTLFLRCRAEFGSNDFTVGYLGAGPNVFLDCHSRESRGFSGSNGSWASGILFDSGSIDGGALRLDNLETWNQGVGWAAANSMLWNSTASVVICRQPPGATNWAVAVWGQFVGDGLWSEVNEFASPASLYRAQLSERLGVEALSALTQRHYALDSPDVPTLEKVFPDLARRLAATPAPAAERPLRLVNGWLTTDGRLSIGGQTGGAWWLGRLEPARASEFGPALTRFAPGRTGTGLTDEVPAVAAAMQKKQLVAYRHHYGLWYDRRRIDHEMVRRPDGDVFPPFYEQPFARSGQGRAWDGLSRYDLTKYNPWYFGRLKEFADEARQRGLVLINEMYFQHNILESGAHWVDSPWRPVNNINDTGFTEPPPFTGDTIKMADEFYDVRHQLRRALHRAYIRQCLANLADQPNVIHTLSAENSGPLHFMQFWLDVVAEWQRETGRDSLIALSAPKDVQDAILADANRAALVDVIDLTYWWRTDTGAEFAPAGGQNLAPRQHQRLWKGGSHSAQSLAGMVRTYREKFPDKAIMSGLDQHNAWAFAAAGGSLPNLPANTPDELLQALARMRPIEAPSESSGWYLSEHDVAWFASDTAPTGDEMIFDLSGATGEFRVHHLDLASGAARTATRTISAAGMIRIPIARGKPAAIWLSR
jgi:hypothetical protein